MSIEILAKSILLGGLGTLISLLFWKRSAAFRHSLWLAVMLALLALPVLAYLGPTISIPAPEIRDDFAPAQLIVPLARPMSRDPSAKFTAEEPVQAERGSVEWSTIISVIWVAASVLCLMRQLFSLILASRIVSRSRQSGMFRGLRVRLSDRIEIPATIGIIRPLILLPKESAEWPTVKLEIALEHEAAHIRRRDWLWMQVAGITLAINILNPFAWFVVNQLRAESELACDDAVIASGFDEADYARELLSVCRSARRSIPDVVLGMARHKGLKKRIQRICGRGIRRSPASKGMTVGLTLLGFLITIPLGGAVWIHSRSSQDQPQVSMHEIEGAAIPGPDWKGSKTVQVEDELGRPILNAKLFVQFRDQASVGFGRTRHPLVTDSHGVCRFTGGDFAVGSARGNPDRLLAYHEGFGLQASEIRGTSKIVSITLHHGTIAKIRLIDPSNNPVSGVRIFGEDLVPPQPGSSEIWLEKHLDLPTFKALTDSNGEATLSDLPIGYRLGISTFGERFVDMGPYGSGGAQLRILSRLFPYGPGQPEAVFKLTIAHSVSGLVTNRGRPVPKIHLVALLTPSNQSAVSVTDSNGRYRFKALKPGEYVIQAYGLPAGFTSRVQMARVDKSDLTGLNFSLLPGGIVSGLVRYQDGSTPDNQDRFIAFRAFGPSFPAPYGKWVEVTDGCFSFRGVAGNYFLKQEDVQGVAVKADVSIQNGKTTKLIVKLPNPPGPLGAATTVSAFKPGVSEFFGPAKLSDGHEARIAFVQRNGTKPWKPDGSPPSSEDLKRGFLMRHWIVRGHRSRNVFCKVDLDEPLGDLDFIVSVPHRSYWNIWQSYGDETKKHDIDLVAFQAPDILRTSDLRLGIGHGPFVTKVEESLWGPILAAEVSADEKTLKAKLPERVRGLDLRMVAFGEDGKMHTPSMYPGGTISGNPNEKFEFQFDGMNLHQIRRIALQARAWDYVTFTGVHLWPNN